MLILYFNLNERKNRAYYEQPQLKEEQQKQDMSTQKTQELMTKKWQCKCWKQGNSEGKWENHHGSLQRLNPIVTSRTNLCWRNAFWMKHNDKTLVWTKLLVTRRKWDILCSKTSLHSVELLCWDKKNKDHQKITEAAALVVIVRSTAAGAIVGSTADVCLRRGSRSMVPPPFCKEKACWAKSWEINKKISRGYSINRTK
jgi:hypothetical protein